MILISFSGAHAETLPPKAQLAMDRGMLAAKHQKWNEAIEAFIQARKLVGEKGISRHPEILFNLALANDKAPGRMLTAAAWYQAYLVAVPKAQNIKAIKKRIKTLIKAYDELIWQHIWTVEKKILAYHKANLTEEKMLEAIGEGSFKADVYFSFGKTKSAFAAAQSTRSHFGDPQGAVKQFRKIKKPRMASCGLLASAIAGAGHLEEAKQVCAGSAELDNKEKEQLRNTVDESYAEYQKSHALYQACAEPLKQWVEVGVNSEGLRNQRFFADTKNSAVDDPLYIKEMNQRLGNHSDPKAWSAVMYDFGFDLRANGYARMYYRWAKEGCRQ